MVVVKLIGGLGNQLFQYALAKNLAKKLKTNVVLDVIPFNEYKLHKYSLEHFNFEKQFLTQNEQHFFGIECKKNFSYLYYRLLSLILKPKKIIEKDFSFDKSILENTNKHIYLDGFWQSEKYFSEIKDELLKDLFIVKPLAGKNLEIANQIKKVNAISLHIRRADYVSNSKTLSVHGVCGLDYYENALKLITNKIENPILFIFSDDINWVKENLVTNIDKVYVDHNNADTNYEDLRLMSLCKHNIIANSSFSWWGAWLNTNQSKIVIAPKRWYSDVEKNNQTVDLIPDSWIRI